MSEPTKKSPSPSGEGLVWGMSRRRKLVFALAFAAWALLIAALANYAAYLGSMCDDEGFRRAGCSATIDNLIWFAAIFAFLVGSVLLKRLAGQSEMTYG
ncbi:MULTISPECIES: hypothetical protein [unclassified Sphingobium]|uniref:hypothetical protein n=1 Tax=unclassified Sphingobium TaxID=2611147 RepID=UPI0035A63DD6